MVSASSLGSLGLIMSILYDDSVWFVFLIKSNIGAHMDKKVFTKAAKPHLGFLGLWMNLKDRFKLLDQFLCTHFLFLCFRIALINGIIIIVTKISETIHAPWNPTAR